MNVIAIKRKNLLIALVIVALVTLMPITIVVASELGGYVSEKLIGSSGTSNSQLVIGFADSKSNLDIIMGNVENIVNPYMNPDSSAYKLNQLIPLIFMAMFIVFLLAIMATTKKFGVFELIIVVILIYVFYAFLPSIQGMITGLIGG